MILKPHGTLQVNASTPIEDPRRCTTFARGYIYVEITPGVPRETSSRAQPRSSNEKDHVAIHELGLPSWELRS